MESQPKNPELGIILKTFTHAFNQMSVLSPSSSFDIST